MKLGGRRITKPRPARVAARKTCSEQALRYPRGSFRGERSNAYGKSNPSARARLQVSRADEFLYRTRDPVEEATEAVHKTVVSPVRQVSGLFRGLSVGVEALLGGRRRRRHERSVQQDEMFI